MDKIKKQIEINIGLVLVSIIVIVLAKSYGANKFLEWSEYLGSDIVFVMITSLVTMAGWRIVENIKGRFFYNVIEGIVVMCFCIEYGLAIANCNEILVKLIFASLIVFLFIYAIENIMVIRYFKRQMQSKVKNRLGYRNREEE